MGQSSSQQRNGDRQSRRLSRLAELTTQREANNSQMEAGQEEGEQSLLSSGTGRSTGDSPHTIPPSMATFHRQISAQTVPAPRESNVTDRVASAQDEVVYEQEERPLVSMEDLRMGDAPITHITASPMPRQPSVISRIGSRLSHRYSSVEPLADDPGREDISLRRSLSDASPTPTNSTEPRSRNRHSMLGSITNPFWNSPPSRRRFAPISRPIPILVSEDPSARFDVSGTTRQAPTPNVIQDLAQRPSVSPQGLARNSRLARVRRSISGPMETLFGINSRLTNTSEQQEQPSHRVTRLAPTDMPAPDETEYLLPPINVTDTSINLDDREMLNSEDHYVRPGPPVQGAPERPQSWAQRWADRAPSVRREGRRVPNLLRGRSSRLIRRDDETPLSRILQLAAAAIAAQLSGSTDALANLESVGDDQFDGGLNHFVEELNTAAGVANSPNQDSPSAVVPVAPLNFWRVFRFVSPTGEHSSRAPGNDGADQRTVTLVVVGVRSVPSSSIQRDNPDAVESGLDTLLNGPSVHPAPRAGGPGGLLRSLNNRARFGRSSSVSGSTPFPHQYDSQRHQRRHNHSGSRPVSPTIYSQPETMPGSLPSSLVPSVSPHNSPGPSDLATPARRPSSASAAQSQSEYSQDTMGDALSHHHGQRSRSPQAVDDSSSRYSGDSGVRQRRRSDSEYARHRDLGSGAARRNGTIDLDGGPVQGRSWLIYVVGTNLPEDHPAFTTPSLFTDNPSYEDMMLLSNILGPAKPPVASTEDVEASGGLYSVESCESNGSLRATALDGTLQITIPSAESCLVCLEEYTPDQVVRKLSKCVHMFHRECVDLWLTTGRNSCPLCRGQGVSEKASETTAT